MKQGSFRTGHRGFTIVETLIVLAVTGLLLATAILYISGKQNKTQFMTASNDLQQQLQQIINETASGYPGSLGFKCHGNLASGLVTIDQTSPSSNCTFIGKAIQFGTNDQGGDEQILIWPLLGNQQINSGGVTRQVQSLAEAHPTAAASAALSKDWSTAYPLENGLHIETNGTTTGVISFVTSYQHYGSTGLSSGSQQFTAYGQNGSVPNQSKRDAISAINNASYTQTPDVAVCVDSGSTDQHATYTITHDSLAVSMRIAGGSC